ncbi:helix-turn-helix transcriptional regulator [Clostridium weizhouense]|uniref:Helix-turn-helix domain-containing protein n=1 Tax=Clostridium weizhouense TaxID=2859781 RepID=A0ABS7AM71_9CLOT|nr:helix-turn-helix domain-containing protein [Clostridium weizhouense]MBW6408796.1 helix-turn-helix domain-containing protein [Clostridium weizhouense]
MYNRLKGLMTEKNITQNELSKLLEISISTLNFKINGKSDFSIKEAKKVSKFFNKPIEEIFYTNEVSRITSNCNM